jgi:hypothetical protein
MDFANEQSSRGTMKGFVKPAFFVAGWVAAVAMLATKVGSLRTDIEEVLSASAPVTTASATSTKRGFVSAYRAALPASLDGGTPLETATGLFGSAPEMNPRHYQKLEEGSVKATLRMLERLRLGINVRDLIPQ